jgi:hypothetical protein
MSEGTAPLAGQKEKPGSEIVRVIPFAYLQHQQINRCAVGSAMVSFAFSRIGLTIFFIGSGLSHQLLFLGSVGLSLELTI